MNNSLTFTATNNALTCHEQTVYVYFLPENAVYHSTWSYTHSAYRPLVPKLFFNPGPTSLTSMVEPTAIPGYRQAPFWETLVQTDIQSRQPFFGHDCCFSACPAPLSRINFFVKSSTSYQTVAKIRKLGAKKKAEIGLEQSREES